MISKVKNIVAILLSVGALSAVLTACDSNTDVDLFVQAEEVAALGLATLSVSSDVLLINKDEKSQFSASGKSNDATDIPDLNSKVTWTTSNTGLATIDDTGLVTAIADGVVTITATYAYLKAHSTLTINTADLVQITLSGNALIDECKTSEIKARGIFSDGSERVISAGLSFTVSDSSVATIKGATNSAILMTHMPGLVTVEAIKSQVTGTLNIEVADALQELLISPVQADVSVGRTVTFGATGIYADSESADITASTAWTSVDSAIAAFSADTNGIITGVTEGTTNILAACGELSANAVVKVNAVVLDDVEINYDKDTITLDEDDDGYQLTLRAIYSDKTVVNVTDDAEWSNISSASGNIIVSDDDSDKGELTITGTGSATIRAEYEGESATIVITVE